MTAPQDTIDFVGGRHMLTFGANGTVRTSVTPDETDTYAVHGDSVVVFSRLTGSASSYLLRGDSLTLLSAEHPGQRVRTWLRAR